MIRIGVVGHRFLVKKHTVDFVAEQCIKVLQKAKIRFCNVVALSAIAEGADMIFAEVAISLNIPFEIVKPFEKYIEDFETPILKNRYLHLQRMTVKEIKLPYINRSEEAYFKAMQWVVKNSDLLIAVWDGKEGNGIAGTSEAVKLASTSNRDWIHINVINQSTKLHLTRNKILTQ